MKSKLVFLTYILAVILTIQVKAQENDPKNENGDNKKPDWKEKITFGGNIGASFGTNTYLHISPMIGYRFTNKFSLGLRGTYEYFKSRNWEFSIYGSGLFARYVVFRNFYAHAEYQPLNVQKFTNNQERMWIHGVLVGGGYRQPVGQKAYVHIELLYDLNETIYTPYDNPMIRVGFSF